MKAEPPTSEAIIVWRHMMPWRSRRGSGVQRRVGRITETRLIASLLLRLAQEGMMCTRAGDEIEHHPTGGPEESST
jgi:hypothetical protein